LSAWIGGLWGGLAGTTIATLLVWYVFTPPRFSFALDSPTAALPILLFLVMGALFAFFFISVIEDIQAHKEAAAGAIASDRRYRDLVESANSAIVRCAMISSG